MSTAKAKDAASLIIYRQGSRGKEVLLGRRNSRAKFAPGVFVFPGGRLEAADSSLPASLPFNMHGLAKNAMLKIQGLAHAAIRETWEETGLLLGQRGQLPPSTHPTWEKCRQQGMVPASEHLSYLGRAITPSVSRIRFHARFFVAPIERFQGSLVKSEELSDLQWIPLAEPVNVPMMDVTEFMLDELQRFFEGKRTGTPLISYRRDRTLVRYEHR